MVNWLLPLPPSMVALVRDVFTSIVWFPEVTCAPEAVMLLLPAVPVTVRLLMAELWASSIATGPARLPRSMT